MDNAWAEMERALSVSREVQSACDRHAGAMARLLEGHLRSVPFYLAARLKKELRNFNIHTSLWRD